MFLVWTKSLEFFKIIDSFIILIIKLSIILTFLEINFYHF